MAPRSERAATAVVIAGIEVHVSRDIDVKRAGTLINRKKREGTENRSFLSRDW